jgi:hypothetical protein
MIRTMARTTRSSDRAVRPPARRGRSPDSLRWGLLTAAIVGTVLLGSSWTVAPASGDGRSLASTGIRATADVAGPIFESTDRSFGTGNLTASGPDSGCALTPATSPSCGVHAVSSDVSPTPVLGFQRSTLSRDSPPAVAFANAAWDAAASELVFFGGSSDGVGQTWVLSNGTWQNLTGSGPAPAARWGATMSYDAQPGVDSVVLFGGCGSVCPMNDTWLFSGTGWREVTAREVAPPAAYFSSSTGWGANGTLLYGGCRDNPCSIESNQTWAFQDTPTCEGYFGAPCWTNLTRVENLGRSSPPGLAGSSLALDPTVGPVNGTAVLYGGQCDTCSSLDTNATWLFDGSRWTDATGSYSGPVYPRQGRAFASLFWDPASSRLYLYGGLNQSTGAGYTELYATDVDSWFSASSPVDPVATFGMATASGLDFGSPSPLPSVLVGGNSTTAGWQNSTWAFEPSVVTAVHVVPVIAETNAPVHFFSNSSGGYRASAEWIFGDGASSGGGNASHAYPRASVYAARLNVTDDCGVQNITSISVTVLPFALGLVVPTTLDAGATGVFSSAPANGTAPFNFTWSFSDGTVAFGPSVSHVFSSPGPADVVVTVRDAVGTNVSERLPITVNSSLSGLVTASPPSVDEGATTIVSASGVGGSPSYNCSWTLPNGRTAIGPNVTYLATSVGEAEFGVTIRDQGSGIWTTTFSLRVYPALTFSASASATNFFSGRTVSFSVAISGGAAPYSYAWHFGDGGTSTSSTPHHKYSGSGTFLVNVWVNDSGGGHFHQLIDAKVARISGGLIWDLAGLPLWQLIAVGAAVLVAVGALAALVVRRSRRARAAEVPVSPGGKRRSP